MNKQIYIGILFLFALLLGGCTGEEYTGGATEPDNGEEGLVPITFCLQPESMQVVMNIDGNTQNVPVTRVDNAEDAVINNLTVLQFDWDKEVTDAGTGEDALCLTSRYLRAPELTDGQITIGLRGQETDGVERKQYIVIIANAGSVFQQYENKVNGKSKTLGDFRSETATLDQKTTSAGNVLMIGAATISILTETSGPIEVDLKRLVACVHFSWINSLTNSVSGATFKPLTLKIGNVPKELRYADGLDDNDTGVYPDAASDNFKDYTSVVSNIEAGYTWYIPLNRRGTGKGGSSAWEKGGTNVPDDYCTYVELSGEYTDPNISNQLVSFRFYPGGDITNDYNVKHNCSYELQAALTGINTLDKRVTMRSFLVAKPANCFVLAPEAGSELLFNPYEAPGEDVAGTGVVYQNQMVEDRFSRIAGVKTLWQTAGNLLQSVSFSQGMVSVLPNATGVSGNALIAVCDEAGTILWSWHIWVTPYAGVLDGSGTNGKTQKYAECIWMDRNLGALNTLKGDVGAYGIYYQWGRKDPFVTSIASGGTTLTVKDMGTALNIDQSVENPTVFFKNQTTDLWYGGEALFNLWVEPGSNKTLFDPCPSGWRIPAKTTWGTFIWGTNFSWDTANPSGANRAVDGGELPAWYPLSGRLNNSSMARDGNTVYLWSASIGSKKPYVFQFTSGACTTIETSGAWGAGVRCVKQ